MLRRQLLRGGLASAVAAGGAVFGARAALGAGAAGGTRVRLGYVGTPCEAATFVAPGSEIYRRNHLDARLVSFTSEDALLAALGAGKIDAASMNLPALLKPIESKLNLRIVAGLHAGCLRVVAPDDVIVRTFGNLKGTKIATDRLHGPSMNLLSALLRRQGVDPRHDVSWEVYAYEGPALESALDSKAVDCVAAQDPLGYLLLADKKAEPYLNTADGGFTCGVGIGRGHHCFLTLSGEVVDSRPEVAASLTRAYLQTTGAIGRGVGPAALAQVQGGFTFADMYQTIGMLSSYDWSPSTDFVLEEIELTARDFRRAGLLKASTDPEQLADSAYANVLHV